MDARRAGNLEVAQQWIEYLQKKNAILNLVWSVMLVVILVLSVASFFFYHQYETSRETELLKLNKIAELSEQLDKSRHLVKETENKVVSLEQEVALLQTVKASLEEQKGVAQSELVTKNELLAGLKLQLTEVEKDNLEATRSLLLAKKDLALTKQKEQKEVSTLKSSYNKSVGKLNKALDAKSTAYSALVNRQKETKEEMQRLADLLDTKTTELSRLKREKDSLSQMLASSQKELSIVQNEYESLERKFEFAIAPIKTGSSAPTLKATAAGTPDSSTDQPKQEKKAKQPKSSFDFDAIAID